jgi:hypothetical protein
MPDPQTEEKRSLDVFTEAFYLACSEISKTKGGNVQEIQQALLETAEKNLSIGAEHSKSK